MKTFKLPDLGEGLAEAEIREWYVAEGDTVKVEQPLAAMETAKALVDVPSPYAGKIIKLFGKPGDIIKTGHPLVGFEGEEETKHDKGTVVGALETGSKILQESATGVQVSAGGATRIKATPAVRALAKALNVDLTNINGTGPGNTITLEDVNKAAGSKTEETPAPEKTFGEPLRGARRAMAMNMAIAHKEIVPITLQDRADIHNWPTGQDMTLRIIRAIAVACHTESSLNAHFDGKNLSRLLFKEINLGLAIDTKEGLYVPVLKDVSNRTNAEIRETIEKFKSYAKNQAFPAEELKGATIALSNFGTIAGRYANPLIVPPTVAIIGIGKASDEVVAVAGKAVIHRILPISLTFDHRAATGGEAARFLAALIEDLQASHYKN